MCDAERSWKQGLGKDVMLVVSMMSLAGSVSFAQEDPTEVLSAAVRQQGYDCDRPERAEPDPQDSLPDEKAWILYCEEGAFRVKFMGDAGANVEPVTK